MVHSHKIGLTKLKCRPKRQNYVICRPILYRQSRLTRSKFIVIASEKVYSWHGLQINRHKCSKMNFTLLSSTFLNVEECIKRQKSNSIFKNTKHLYVHTTQNFFMY